MKTAASLLPGAKERLSIIDRLLEEVHKTPESTLGNKCDALDEAIYIILSFQTDLPRAAAIWSRLPRSLCDVGRTRTSSRERCRGGPPRRRIAQAKGTSSSNNCSLARETLQAICPLSSSIQWILTKPSGSSRGCQDCHGKGRAAFFCIVCTVTYYRSMEIRFGS